MMIFWRKVLPETDSSESTGNPVHTFQLGSESSVLRVHLDRLNMLRLLGVGGDLNVPIGFLQANVCVDQFRCKSFISDSVRTPVVEQCGRFLTLSLLYYCLL